METDNDTNWKDCWKKPVKVQYREITETAEIETREGKLFGYAGQDVLIRGIKGEVYPCKIDIFKGTYSTTPPANIDFGDFIKELRNLTLKYSGKCDNPFCIYGDEAEAAFNALLKSNGVILDTTNK